MKVEDIDDLLLVLTCDLVVGIHPWLDPHSTREVGGLLVSPFAMVSRAMVKTVKTPGGDWCMMSGQELQWY